MGISRFNSEGYYDPVPHDALSSIEKEQRKWKPLVYVASPFAGDEARNTANAIRYCRFAVDSGAIPLAPHLLLPRFMSEASERDAAMFMNMVFLGKCEQLWVFGDRITEGMAAEIAKAEKRRIPVRYFTDDCKEVSGGEPGRTENHGGY